MALYRGTVNLSGLESGFNPENTGSVGQVLTKTATGYNWQNGGGGGGGTYTAGAGINIDINNEISNTLPGAIVSATAPSTATEGMVWYDTTNDVLKTYDGTNWNEVGGATYTAGTGIDITNNAISVDNTIAKAADVGNVRRFENTTASLQAMYDWLYNSTGRYGIVQYNAWQDYIFGPTTATDGRVYSAEGYRPVSLNYSGKRLKLDAYNIYYTLSSGSVSGTLGNVASGSFIGQDVAFEADVLTKTNTTAFTPTADYHPATKKYVDDKAAGVVPASGTAPTSPAEGQLWYDTTNDVLKTYDGTNWKVVGDDTANINTKTFYLSSNSDLTNAQAAYDWYAAGKYPIIIMDGVEYFLSGVSSTRLTFTQAKLDRILEANSKHRLQKSSKYLNISSGTVTSISGVADMMAYYLDTGYNYSSYYTPTNDGHPTSKRYVDDRDVYIGTSAPTNNLVEGRVWYDTTNDVLKTYDGTNWNECGGGASYTAGKGINIGAGHDYSAIKGPCPDGFHIPTKGEADTLRYILIDDFGWAATPDVEDYLNMPVCGYIDKDGNTVYEYDDFPVWTCTSDGGNAYVISGYDGYMEKGSMMPIRPFKDEPVAPVGDGWQLVWRADSDYDNRGQIWRNTDLGIISVSLDLQTWITIADKNIGATVVRNDGDAFTASNVGNLYQWGNNYGIPYGTTPTTSQSQVDASTYGPGNYYSSSTIIRGYSDWSSVENANLRGGETGVTSIPNTITNAGVTSLNGKTGDVFIEAGRGIAIQNGITYIDDRGPCPEGYHLPIDVEMQNMLDVWAALGGNSTGISDFCNAFKLPLAGRRNNATGNVEGQGSQARYWSSSCWNGFHAYSICINCAYYVGGIGVRSTEQASGASIRPFKNTPVTPDGSWTKLYGTSIEEGGIFWSSSKGLISFSGDGTTWTTIADKNLGATTVWTNGDTLSETNCGGYFQRGNNYMFPFTGAVTTSSTQVDTTGYGPGNYYYSSTFVTNNHSWTTGDMSNLRGGATTSLNAENRITNTGVLSVNGQTGDVTIGAIQVASNSPVSVQYVRVGTQTQYDNLSSYDSNTIYYTT